MEPDIIPLHSSSPPPLDDDSDGEAGSDEDEFGDFGGFSVRVSRSPPGFADSTDSRSSLRQPSTTIKPATHQSNCSFNHPVEQSQPTSAEDSGSVRGQIFVEGQDCNAESYVNLSNGFPERDHNSKIHIASAERACSPREETGFADFTVFTEQAAHPWCCGFSPMGGKEQWVNIGGERRDSSNSLGDQICDPEHHVVMDSEPRSHCACKAKENVCTKVKHCEKRDAALVQPSQDHHQPQEAAAALDIPPEEPHSGEEEIGMHGDSARERRHSLSSLQTTEVQEDGELDKDEEDREKSISAVPQTFSVYESASEDLASFFDDLSFEGVSADLEPNVSSLVSQDDLTDCDQTDDDEEEELGIDSMANLRPSEAEKGFQYCSHSVTQETSATSNHSQPGTHTEDSFADFKDCSFEHHSFDQGHVQTADAAVVLSLGNLPPSDSFADFCSAPTQEDDEESWAEFKDQRSQEEEETWTHLREPVSILLTDGDTKEEKDRAEQYGVSRRNSSQDSLSCRVQQLLLASFPQVEFSAVEGEEEVLSLGALLHAQHLPDSEEEEIPELCPRSQWIRRGVWRPHQDLHDAVGLQFQWGGSYANRTLLRCLCVETRNIVFIGMKKQPVAVPAFASSLGMLEPTKDSVPAVCSPGHTAISTTQALPEPRDTPDPSTDSMQEALPSSQLDWSSRGLSSSQDDCSALNLDYFGPEEESRSYSSSSRSNSPPPGVDPELYELTISKLETGASSSHMDDTLNRLMSTAEKTSTSVRKPQPDEELSVEAGRLIAGLPNLYFMQAKVLMFPSILQPKESCSPRLQ
ncbi:aftiphilin [Cottoperca gobio]|uniref:Aftiphilin n=1 Tax=Cottoperca gobio TaxID=56716 RepID=A0A6J2R5K7_COTGO|nr:aftiphilin [Cottoperca gobio]XP_029305455.1 aftiphilin [Cottoperca gobio]XP_029305456.1 aftiphilin [Cottoperca gobio]XP_029305458.1 aftiphilin [Cottoperca gobio]